jgi:hypothetical protein
MMTIRTLAPNSIRILSFLANQTGLLFAAAQVDLDPNMEKGKMVRAEPEEGFANTPSGGFFDRKWGMGGWKLDPEHQSDPRGMK